MVLIGAVVLFLSFSPAIKICRNLIGRVRRKWVIILYLMGFFIFGYLSFEIILIRNLTFPLELLTGGVFLGGAVFVFIVMNISLSTITSLQKAEEAIRVAKDDWESTFYAVTDMITVHDMDFNIIRANPAARAIFGLQQHEGISLKKCFRCYHGTEKPPSGCVSCQSLQTGKPSAFEAFEPHLNKHLEIRAMPRFGTDGRLVGLIHIVRDITERKQAEEALRNSETTLKLLLETIPIPVFYKDKEGRYLGFNNAFEVLFGKSKEQLIGKSVFDISPPELAKVYHAKDAELFETPGVQVYDSQVRDANGVLHNVIFHKASLTDAQGNITGLIGAVLDITERKKAEDALREREEKYRNLFNNAQVGIFRSRIDGSEVTEVNNKFLDIVGMTMEEILGKPSVNLWADPKEREVMEKKLISDGSLSMFECKMLNKRQGCVRNCITSLRFYPELGMLEGSILDITDHKQAEQEKEKLQTKLIQAQKMEAIGTLAGGIAHDFNNILSAVIGYTELAQMKLEADSEINDDLKEVLAASARAKDLINQIHEFSRQIHKERMPVQMCLIVKEALKLIKASLPVTIDIHQNIQSQSLVLSDPTKLHQIVMNLCTNAAYAMWEKGGILDIALSDVELDCDFCSSHPEIQPGDYLKLTVCDTGHGMSADVMDQIFNPFFTTKPKNKGTGLGLSVVHGIVKDLGGTITIYSEPDKGTTFNLYFPIVKGRTKEEPEEYAILSTGNERILVVDDEKAIVDITQKHLSSLGYAVEVRTSSIEALELFKAMPDKFDMVITDVTMIQMTGGALARELMKIRPDLPVILCTGFNENVNKEKAATMGIKSFLLKPIIKAEMARMIRKVLDEAK